MKIGVIDEIVDGIITVIPDDGGEKIFLPSEKYPAFGVNDAVVIEGDGMRAASADEHKNRTGENSERLKKLFEKRK